MAIFKIFGMDEIYNSPIGPIIILISVKKYLTRKVL